MLSAYLHAAHCYLVNFLELGARAAAVDSWNFTVGCVAVIVGKKGEIIFVVYSSSKSDP